MNVKSARKTGLRLGLALFVFIGFELALTYSLSLIFHVKLKSDLLGYIIPYAALYVVGFILFLLICRTAPRTQSQKEHWGFWRLACALAISYAGGFICNITYSVINMIATGSSISTITTKAFTSMVNMNPFFSFAVMAIVAPIVEELVFRKTLIDCTKAYGEKTAIIFSAVMFGLFHMNLQQLFYAFVIGIVFGYVYSRSGNILYTIILHSVTNMIGYFAAFALNGMSTAMGAANVTDLISILTSQSAEQLQAMTTLIPWLLLQYFIMGIAYALLIIGIIFFFKKAIKVRFSKNAPMQLSCAAPLYVNVGVILFAVLSMAMLVIRQIFGTL